MDINNKALNFKSVLFFFVLILRENFQTFIDLIFVFISLWVSLSILENGFYPINFNLLYLVLATSLVFLLSTYLTNFYKVIHRFTVYEKTPFLLKFLILYVFLFSGFIFINPRSGIPTLLIFFHPIILAIFIIFREKISVKKSRKTYNFSPREYVVIYGAGKLGYRLSEYLIDNNKKIFCFIDDDNKIWGKLVNGIEVMPPESLSQILLLRDFSHIYIAFNNPTNEKIEEILNLLKNHQYINLKIAPSFSNRAGHINNNEVVRDLSLDDLIGRREAAPILPLLERKVSGRNILVTGAAGSIGKALCLQLINLKVKKLILVDSSELGLYELINELRLRINYNSLDIELIPVLGSVSDNLLIESVVVQHQPYGIYHAAAYKHVSLLEKNIISAVKNNVLSTYNVAQVCLNHNINFCVLISSDKAVKPKNIMGLTKKISELIVRDKQKDSDNTTFSIVRFGNVLNSSGSVVPLFKKQIQSGGPVTLTDVDVTRYFMSISEASSLVIQASSLATSGDIFILDMGRPIKIYDLAKKLILLYGQNTDIEIKVTGLAHGEKLHEELYDGALEVTEHPKIAKCYEVHPEKFDADKFIKGLINCLEQMDTYQLELFLREHFEFDWSPSRD